MAMDASMKDARFAEHLAYVDAVRGGSLASVARCRGVTPSSILKQIAALEGNIGVKLPPVP
jgi:DNA-binding transcriptional LysR family regulator